MASGNILAGLVCPNNALEQKVSMKWHLLAQKKLKSLSWELKPVLESHPELWEQLNTGFTANPRPRSVHLTGTHELERESCSCQRGHVCYLKPARVCCNSFLHCSGLRLPFFSDFIPSPQSKSKHLHCCVRDRERPVPWRHQ